MKKIALLDVEADSNITTQLQMRVLRLMLPFGVIVGILMTLITWREPFTPPSVPAGFAAMAAILVVVGVLLTMNLVSVAFTGLLSCAALVFAIWGRVLSLYLGPLYIDADASVMHMIYGYVPLIFILFSISLPFPMSLWASLVSWITISGSATALLVSLPGPVQLQSGAQSLLLMLWLGYPVFLAIITSVTQWQLRLLQMFKDRATLAEVERSVASQAVRELEAIFSQAAVGVAILDRHGSWLAVNDRLCEITGYSELELKQKKFHSITHKDDRERDVAQAQRLARHEIDRFELDKRYVHKSGNPVWVRLHVSRLNGETRDEDQFISVVEDISERKAAESQVEAFQVELEDKIKARTKELEALHNVITERSQKIEHINDLLGMLPSAQNEAEACALIAQEIRIVLPETSGALYLRGAEEQTLFALAASWGEGSQHLDSFLPNDCWAVRRGQFSRSKPDAIKLRCSHLSDREDAPQTACYPLIAHGQITGVITATWQQVSDDAAMQSDESLLKSVGEQLSMALMNVRLRDTLQYKASRDHLTGLLNRSTMLDRIRQSCALAKREAKQVAFLMIDLDHFKRVNDKFGHDVGDRVLQAAATVLENTTRESDFAFRLGGEEFLLVLPDTDINGASVKAEKIRTELNRNLVVERGQALPKITCSIGIAAYPMHGENIDRLLITADQALYTAKRNGRDQFVVATSTDDALATAQTDESANKTPSSKLDGLSERPTT